MNSAPLSDSAAFAGVVPMERSAPTPLESATEFGEVLAEVEEGEEEKKESPAESITGIPLAFFFTPPELKPVPKLEVEASIEPPKEAETGSPEAPDVRVASGAQVDQVLDIVRPTVEKAEAGKFSLKGFEAIAPEAMATAPLQALQAPPKGGEEPHGTFAAKQVEAMKNGQKSAEIAPAIEQKMPVGEQSRRVLPEQARFEIPAFVADTFARAKGEALVGGASPEVAVRSLEAVEVIETIRTEVAHLRQRGDASVTVVLKPDTGTELKLEITVARDGTIQANARFERGDFQSLNAQWGQLQQSLAAQGIRVTDLSNPNGAHQNNDSEHGKNFDRGNNSQNRQQQPDANFEEELAASTPRFAINNKLNPAAAPLRRWQSWA